MSPGGLTLEISIVFFTLLINSIQVKLNHRSSWQTCLLTAKTGEVIGSNNFCSADYDLFPNINNINNNNNGS